MTQKEIQNTPRKILLKNTSRLDLRKYSLDFRKTNFLSKHRDEIKIGQIYAFNYSIENKNSSDIFHEQPLILVLNNLEVITGLNLFFLNSKNLITILEAAYNLNCNYPKNTTLYFNKLLEDIKKTEMNSFLHEFNVSKIINSSEIKIEEWGMIPLLRKNQFGIFNETALVNSKKKVPDTYNNKKSKKKEIEKPKFQDQETEEIDFTNFDND